MVTNSTVNALLLAVDSTSLDEEKAEPILKTFLEVDADFVEKPKDVLGGFKEVCKASKQNMEKETVEETLKWVAVVSSKANLNDQNVLKVSLKSHVKSQCCTGTRITKPKNSLSS